MIPKISVVFPIYNNEMFIENCVRSVMNQTLKEIELLLIDDGSNDRTPQILDMLSEEDDRIKVIHKINEGSAKARNLGIEIAKGEYIAFVESDDSVSINMYECLYRRAGETQAEIVKCSFFKKSGDEIKEVEKICKIAKDGEVFNVTQHPEICLCHASIWGGIYKKSFLNDNKLRFIETPRATYSDFSWMAMTYAYAKKITVYNKAFYYYTYDNPASSHFMYGKNFHYKILHSKESLRILKMAGVYEEVKEWFDYAAFCNCVDAAGNVSKESQNMCFAELKELCDQMVNDDLKLLNFSNRNKYLYDLICHDKRDLFYDFLISKYTIFDYEDLKGKRIILFGAGSVGRSLERQLTKWNSFLVKWVDNNPDGKKGVESVDHLNEIEYDYILIAIYDIYVAKQIKKQLIDLGIDEQRILWRQVFEYK